MDYSVPVVDDSWSLAQFPVNPWPTQSRRSTSMWIRLWPCPWLVQVGVSCSCGSESSGMKCSTFGALRLSLRASGLLWFRAARPCRPGRRLVPQPQSR
eukprot:3213105-Alexandrium_andersonii.AAC.1